MDLWEKGYRGQAPEVSQRPYEYDQHDVGTVRTRDDVRKCGAYESGQHRPPRKIENTQTLVQTMITSVEGQALIIRNTKSLVTRLFNIVSGDLKSSWQHLIEMIAKVCVSTQQIYGVLLEVKGSMADTRWTFFQAPYAVEDAFGFKFPVPSEYDFEMLNKIVQWRFHGRESYADIQAGNYELYKSQNHGEVISSKTFLVPGCAITMAVIVECRIRDDEHCPMPHCCSTTSLVTPNGGRTCAKRGVCFGQATKPRESLSDFFRLLDVRSEGSVADTGETKPGSNYKGPHGPPSTDLQHVRHVRWAGNDEGIENRSDEVLATTQHESNELHPLQDTTPCSAMDIQEEKMRNESLAFLVGVEWHDPQKYNCFLHVMRAFKAGIIDTPGVMERVARLFHDSDSLIHKFSDFLPPGYSMSIMTRKGQRYVHATTPEGQTTRNYAGASIKDSIRVLRLRPVEGIESPTEKWTTISNLSALRQIENLDEVSSLYSISHTAETRRSSKRSAGQIDHPSRRSKRRKAANSQHDPEEDVTSESGDDDASSFDDLTRSDAGTEVHCRTKFRSFTSGQQGALRMNWT